MNRFNAGFCVALSSRAADLGQTDCEQWNEYSAVLMVFPVGGRSEQEVQKKVALPKRNDHIRKRSNVLRLIGWEEKRELCFRKTMNGRSKHEKKPLRNDHG